MSVNLIWDTEVNNIIHAEALGELTSDDLRIALYEVVDMIQSKEDRVDIVFQASSFRNLPRNILTQIGGFIRESPNNFGMLVLIGQDTYIESLIITFWRLYPFEATRVHLAADTGQAYSAIEKARQLAR